VVGFASQQIVSKLSCSSLFVATQNPSSIISTTTSKINVVQSMRGKSHQPKIKKKGRGKKKKDNYSQEMLKIQQESLNFNFGLIKLREFRIPHQ